MHKLVLLRHGQSTWNQENRFTGWQDVDLTERGIGEAHTSARRLMDQGFSFDIAFTSVLKRAIRTLWIVMDDMDLMWIPVVRSWKLNERHYGALQGLNKAETARKFGEDQVQVWRRSYDVPPPALGSDDARFPGNDRKYADISTALLPKTECLKDTVARVVPYWDTVIKPAIAAGRKVIIAAHGNSLRALVKHLDGISDADILKLNIPTGIPLIYELDDAVKAIRRFYLASDAELKQAQDEVAAQGKAGK